MHAAKSERNSSVLFRGREGERGRAIMGIRINVVSIDRVIDEKIIK